MTKREFDIRLNEIEDKAIDYSEECAPVEIYLRESPYDGWEANYRYNDDDFPDTESGTYELGTKILLAEKYCDILRERIKELYDDYFAEEE